MNDVSWPIPELHDSSNVTGLACMPNFRTRPEADLQFVPKAAVSRFVLSRLVCSNAEFRRRKNQLASYSHKVKLNAKPTLYHNACVAAAISFCLFSQRVIAYSQQDFFEAQRRASDAAAANPSDPLARNRVLENELHKINLSPKEAASYMFFAFYRKNMIGVPAVCAEHGVDVKDFVSAFARIHEPLLKIAGATIDLEQAKSYTDPVESARAELERVVATRHTYMKGLCSVIAVNGAAIAERGKFATVVPQAYAMLTTP